MILGESININNILNNSNSKETISQWIGASNVIRNQKIKQYQNNNFHNTNSSYAYLKKDFEFLKNIPPQILRNSAAILSNDIVAAKKEVRQLPKIKPKYAKRKAIITKELFNVVKINEQQSQIIIYNNATKKRKKLFFVNVDIPHQNIKNQLTISRKKDKFTLSFAFDDGKKSYSNEELLSDFSYLEESELIKKSIGVDSGVKVNAYLSNGNTIAYSMKEAEKLKKINNKIAKKQRYLAKQKKRFNRFKKRQKITSEKYQYSNRQKKTSQQIAKCHNKIKQIRFNFNHHASKEIVKQTPKICVLEDLNLKAMTKKAKPKLSEDGKKYIKNNKKQKSGLNKSILNVNMGQLKVFLKYKLNQENKAIILVNPYNTSQQCFNCKSLNTKRVNQALLQCFDCNSQHQADYNASLNIQYKGIQELLNKPQSKKIKKRISYRKNTKREADEPRLSIKNSVERSDGFLVSSEATLYRQLH